MEGVPNTSVEMQLERPRGGPLSHVWLRLGDGRALDPSADQFVLGLLPVYLGEPLAAIHAGEVDGDRLWRMSHERSGAIGL
jgi:hypothetical protein